MSTAERKVIRAGPADLEVLIPLFEAYRRFYRRPPDAAGSRRFLSERFENGESVVFLASLAGDGVGFTQLYPLFSSLGLCPVWLLNDLYVVDGARRHGVARALLRAAREHATDSGARGLLLQTAVDNSAAQMLYESDGWTRQNGFYWYELSLPNS